MKNFKSHFTFNSQQRSGIFFMLISIALIQILYFTIDLYFQEDEIAFQEIADIQKAVDSLKLVEIENRKPKRYPFNPNFISDYKGYVYGMSIEEIDRLHTYRNLGKFVNSAEEFQRVTKISDSLLETMKPYFKFPSWIQKHKQKKQGVFQNKAYSKPNALKEIKVKLDLNTATATQLRKVYGIGEKLSQRIIKYRNKLGGFVLEDQLNDVYGLKPEVVARTLNQFKIITKPNIAKVKINSCEVNELVKIPYINYELADEIINQRILREGFENFNDLTKIRNFPIDKIKIIELYLTFD